MHNLGSMIVELQLSCALTHEVPYLVDINRWVITTLATVGQHPAEITVRVVDVDEMTDLNNRYRDKNRPTNVLAFPFETVVEVDYNSLGDIVICFPVIKNESNQRDITFSQHFAHMVIHGTLHLCGFDHQTDEEATEMENLENEILAVIFEK